MLTRTGRVVVGVPPSSTRGSSRSAARELDALHPSRTMRGTSRAGASHVEVRRADSRPAISMTNLAIVSLTGHSQYLLPCSRGTKYSPFMGRPVLSLLCSCGSTVLPSFPQVSRHATMPHWMPAFMPHCPAVMMPVALPVAGAARLPSSGPVSTRAASCAVMPTLGRVDGWGSGCVLVQSSARGAGQGGRWVDRLAALQHAVPAKEQHHRQGL